MLDKLSNAERENILSDAEWDDLLYRISKGRCTPFLGAGVNHGILPLGPELADKLATEFDYPFRDCDDLAKVAQFVALNRDPVRAKETVLDLLMGELEQRREKAGNLDLLKDPNQPLSVMADLPLPVYMTTNYDDLIFRALQAKQKAPRREFCRWNSVLRSEPSIFNSEPDFDPQPATPLVFHLHGYDELEQSLVLTEDDYVDFMVNLSRDQDIILPPRIQRAMTRASLLFIGYGLTDWDFRVIFRGLVGSMERGLRRTSVAVQLTPEDMEEHIREARKEYLSRYFQNLDIKVYWGTAQEFAAELREKWENYSKK